MSVGLPSGVTPGRQAGGARGCPTEQAHSATALNQGLVITEAPGRRAGGRRHQEARVPLDLVLAVAHALPIFIGVLGSLRQRPSLHFPEFCELVVHYGRH